MPELIYVKLSGVSRFCTTEISQYLIYIMVIVIHLLSYVMFILTKDSINGFIECLCICCTLTSFYQILHPVILWALCTLLISS